MKLISRIQFFIVTSLLNGSAIYSIANPDFEYYPIAIGAYFGILLPVVYFRLETLKIDTRSLVLGLTPFTLMMFCLYLTVASDTEEKRSEYIVIK